MAFLIFPGLRASCGEIKQMLFRSLETNMLGFTSCRWNPDSKKNMFRVENHMKLIHNHHLQRDTLKSCQLSMASICLIIPGATFSKRNLKYPTWWIGFLQGGHSWMFISIYHISISGERPKCLPFMIPCDISRLI